MKTKPFLIRTTAAAVLTMLAGLAHAELSTDGYFRVGTGAGVKNDPDACFGLGGDGLKYRLGNECDHYIELNIKNTVKAGGVTYSANVMPTLWNAGQDSGDAKFGLAQAYIEGKGFDILPEANFWVGKRFYARSDVHIVDTKFTVEDGVGGGVDGITLGSLGKLGIAYFRRDENASTGWGVASRLNVEVNSINTNTDGWLRVVTGFVSSEEDDSNSGTALTVQHYQHNFLGLGGGNTLWVQYARGAANLNTGFDNAVDAEEDKSWRVADSITFQQGNWGGQTLAMYQESDDGWGKTKSTSLGGRLTYAFTQNFKLVGELGLSQKKPYWGEAQKLNKFTIAPTLAMGKGFWDRPELRLYYTHANWNDAAAAAGNGLPANRTSANRYGVQAEIWW